MSAPVLVARLGDLAPGTSKTFRLDAGGGREAECFLVHWGGAHHAWVNRCRHVTISLDWVENRFFDEEKRHLLCSTHGALYEPDTGLCVAGPPCGKRLVRVPLEIRGEEIWARAPESFEDVI